MNWICELILDTLEVEIEYHFGTNEYDNGTIRLNVLDHTTFGKAIKLVMGRPVDKNWALYHELGHAIADHYNLAEDKEIKRLFGDFNQEYHGNWALIGSAAFSADDDHLTSYAMTHPEEDWADTVAYVITNYSKLKNKKEGSTLLDQKIYCAKEWIKWLVEVY